VDRHETQVISPLLVTLAVIVVGVVVLASGGSAKTRPPRRERKCSHRRYYDRRLQPVGDRFPAGGVTGGRGDAQVDDEAVAVRLVGLVFVAGVADGPAVGEEDEAS
jgi:hypothetical protein